ncbi:MAG: dihydrolipoyl dehydrogenase [Prevotellaceae bacterium]|jgi:dihydrolipoamide dehydrogenase|nr:dihydrolipoyl dehydrogenase [Prevotellaceae bacterium]
MYDLGIIGGGPAGYTAAERAAANGLKVIIFERGNLGGVCLNGGCIPTKTLLYSAKLLESAKSASKYGIQMEQISADFGKIMSRKNKVVRKLVAGIKAKMNHEYITHLSAQAIIRSKTIDGFELKAGDTSFDVKRLLICTGSENIHPPIPGLQPENVWSSREALSAKEQPQSLTIIGGGVIGMEFAGFFNALGTKVTVIEMMPEILGNMDSEISAMLREEYTKKGIVFHLSSKVTKINGKEIIVETGQETKTVVAEQVLLSVGRRPVTAGFGLDVLNIDIHRGGIAVNSRMQTSEPCVYAAGDVTGFSLLAHTAVREAEVAVNNILGKDDEMSYTAIPGVVYTNPEVAGVGETEDSLREKGVDFHVLKLPMTFSGRFVAENEGGNGLCKIIVGKDEKILGVHLIGNPCSEIITTATLAIERNLTAEEWQKSIFPHPTVGEILKESLFAMNHSC